MLAAWRNSLETEKCRLLSVNVILWRCAGGMQTALKTLHVFHRLMRECDTHLLQLVRAAYPACLYPWMSLWWDLQVYAKGS